VRLTASGVTPFVAFGYLAAAARGEIPPVLSRERVAAWIASRPWAQEKRLRLECLGRLREYTEWCDKLVEEVLLYLERTAVVHGTGKADTKGKAADSKAAKRQGRNLHAGKDRPV